MRQSFIVLLLFLVSCFQVTGQPPAPPGSDSIQIKLEKIEREQLQDSLSKITLEETISSLKQSETQKRLQLERQLREIQTRDSIRLQLKRKEIEQLRSTTIGYPVMGMLNDTLFLIYTNRGGFSASARAEAISKRIEKLAKDLVFQPDSLKWDRNEANIEINYGESVIMTLSESDAIWKNKELGELANLYTDAIRKAISHYRSETSFATLAKEIGFALGILLLVGVIIFLITKFFRWVKHYIQAGEGKSLKGFTINNYTILDSQREVFLLQKILVVVKWVSIILTVYFSLPLLFGIFPWTRGMSNTLMGYVLHPTKKIAWSIWNYLPNIITISLIWMLFHYTLKLYRFLKTEIETGKLKIPGFYAEWANPSFQIVRVLHYAFLFIIIFPYLPGSHSPIFKGVSVFLGFLFTFGSVGSLSNIVAGIVITYMRQFTLGDRVKIGDVTGDVVEKSLLVTRIKTVKNEIISIPNATIMSSHTINYSSEAQTSGLILHTTVTIGYDTPWRLMHEVLIKAANKTEFILSEPEPFVLQASLDDFYISYELNAYTREANKQRRVYSLLHQNIQDCCAEAGIEIMSPHYLSHRDGNKSTIPDNSTS
jgi:small-conductance mechanosensitive channel